MLVGVLNWQPQRIVDTLGVALPLPPYILGGVEVVMYLPFVQNLVLVVKASI